MTDRPVSLEVLSALLDRKLDQVKIHNTRAAKRASQSEDLKIFTAQLKSREPDLRRHHYNMAVSPTKQDISTIFKRLRSIPTNKQCFDCRANNPTWASVTYGVFLCIDCSAIHRSLGVHLTFIRSTQLDTSWTWLQLRAMQVGGNANAVGFFRQHGCDTTDAQRKYHSRAAILYKEKLHAAANSAQRLNGTKAIISSSGHHSGPTSPTTQDVDFFKEHATAALSSSTIESGDLSTANQVANGSLPQPIKNGSLPKDSGDGDGDGDADEVGPNVEAALSTSPTQVLQRQQEPRKSTITGRKAAGAKKGGFGGKKLGAQKVKTDFSTIENEAQQKDKEKEQMSKISAQHTAKSSEDQAKQMASMRLAYQDISLEKKKQEEKLKASDPKKAEQMERLGMGFGGNRGISHSVVSDMKTIEQENPNKSSSAFDRYSSKSRSRDFFEDELEMIGGSGKFSSGPPKYSDSPFGSRDDETWGRARDSSPSGWGMDRFDSQKSSSTSDEMMFSKEKDDRSGRSRKNYEVSSSEDAQKKFGNAKSISSAQYFGDKDNEFERQQNLSRFEGSSGISSADYFGTEPEKSRSYRGSGPDLSEIKEGVKMGVSKVAGKLSSLANGVVSSLQRK